MSGLREGFEQIATDARVYGDVERAIEQVGREQRRRYALVAGLATAAATVTVTVTVIVGVLAVTRDGHDSQKPSGPTTPTVTRPDATPDTTPTDTPETTPPVNPLVNGDLVGAEDHFSRALGACDVLLPDGERDPGREDCAVRVQDVDAASDVGLFLEEPADAADAANDPDWPDIETTLRVGTPDGVIASFRCPYVAYQCEPALGPRPDEVSFPQGQEITVVGFDGRYRRTIDLSAVLDPPGDRDPDGETVTSVEWSPDRTRAAVVTRRSGQDGLSARLWIVGQDDTEPELVHTSITTESIPSGGPLAYLWSVVWSPDGSTLGFVEEHAYIHQSEVSLWIRAESLALTGSGTDVPRTLYDYATTPYDEATFVWSPDGMRVGLKVPEQVLELSAENGKVLARSSFVEGHLIWLADKS